MTAHEFLRYMAKQPEGVWVEPNGPAQDTAIRLRRRSMLEWRYKKRIGKGKRHVDYIITPRGLKLLEYYDKMGCVTEICKECGGKRSRRLTSGKARTKKASPVSQEEGADGDGVRESSEERTK